mmetsp:Transcript_1210/g.3391  ORF Transcript_1210/g.3391 Transcript_1210/m.3391 type:complete len:207 (+) Transcript_1210:612-1232(+)
MGVAVGANTSMMTTSSAANRKSQMTPPGGTPPTRKYCFHRTIIHCSSVGEFATTYTAYIDHVSIASTNPASAAVNRRNSASFAAASRSASTARVAESSAKTHTSSIQSAINTGTPTSSDSHMGIDCLCDAVSISSFSTASTEYTPANVLTCRASSPSVGRTKPQPMATSRTRTLLGTIFATLTRSPRTSAGGMGQHSFAPEWLMEA